ncbi:MAG: aspartate aminotransferase family protein, partial [Marinobacter alexandrii]
TKEPVHETVAIAVAAKCKELGVLIGRTNRSLTGHNNIINFSPALIVTAEQIDRIVDVVDQALAEFGGCRLG